MKKNDNWMGATTLQLALVLVLGGCGDGSTGTAPEVASSASTSVAVSATPGVEADREVRVPTAEGHYLGLGEVVAHEQPVAPASAWTFSPNDLMTGVRGTPPRLILHGTLSESEMASLRSSLRLVEWPSKRPIDAVVTVTPPQSMEPATIFTVAPRGEQRDGWSALVVPAGAVPQRFIASGVAPSASYPGYLVARFDSKSELIVVDASAEADVDSTRVTVRLSSRVQLPLAQGQVTVLAGVTPASCTLTGPDANDRTTADGTTYQVVLQCAGAVADPHVRVAAELAALDGTTIGDACGGDVTIAIVPDPAVQAASIAAAARI